MTSKVKTRFYSDLTIEQPFFNDFVILHDGVEKKGKKVNGAPAYQVECPSCKHHIALMGVANDRKTYILICPNDRCTCYGGLNLNQLITNYATQGVKDKWWSARNKPAPSEWFGIKNRRKRGCYQKKSFRELMETKLSTQLILMNNIIKNERSYQLNKNSMHS